MQKKAKFILVVSLMIFLVGATVLYFYLDSIEIDLSESSAEQTDSLVSSDIKFDVVESGRNLSAGESEFGKIIFSKPEDEIELKFVITPGQSLGGTTALVTNTISAVATNVKGVVAIHISGGTSINSVAITDGIMSGGIPVSLNGLQDIVITTRFKNESASSFPVGSSVLDTDIKLNINGASFTPRTRQEARIVVTDDLVQ